MISVTTKKNMEVAVNDILQVLNKEAITEVKVILLFAKKTKRAIEVSTKTKTNRGVDPLRSLKEGKNNQDTTSKVVHDL